MIVEASPSGPPRPFEPWADSLASSPASTEPGAPRELDDDEVDILFAFQDAPHSKPSQLECIEALPSEAQVALVASSPQARQLGRQHSLATSAASSFMDALSDAEPSSPTLEMGELLVEEELPRPNKDRPLWLRSTSHTRHGVRTAFLRPAHGSKLGANIC